MKAGSAIVNTASVQAYQPRPALLAYSSTKGAMYVFLASHESQYITGGIFGLTGGKMLP